MLEMKVDMSLLKITLNVSSLLGVICVFISLRSGNSSNLPITSNSLTRNVVPENYQINLTFNLQNQGEKGKITFFGTCKILLFVEYATSNISLHAEKPYIHVFSNVTAQSNKRDEEFFNTSLNKFYNVRESTYNKESHILVFHFNEKLISGRYNLHMTFEGSASHDDRHFFIGRYNLSTEEQQDLTWLIATDLQPTGARRIFPCWDEPGFKAIFNFIITYHSQYNILLNTRKRFTSVNHDIDMQQTFFKETPAISTCDVAIIMFDSHILSNHSFVKVKDLSSIWYRSNVYKQIKFAKNFFEKATEGSQLKWQIFNDNPDRTLVLIPGFRYEVKKNWGLPFYREASFIHDPDTDTFANQIKVGRFVSREAINWLYVDKPSHQSDMWLREGTFTLFTALAVREIMPESRIFDLLVVEDQRESVRLDCLCMHPLSRKVDSTSEMSSSISPFYYLRAPAMLRMLQFTVAENGFWTGILKYLKNLSMTLNNFCTIMQDIYDEEPVENKIAFNVRKAMNGWINLKFIPVLSVKNRNSSHIEIMIENNEDLKRNVDDLWLPLTIVTQSNPNFAFPEHWEHREWLTLQKFKVKFYPLNVAHDWVIVNTQQIGYFHVKYDIENWRKLTSYLNSTDYKDIHVLNRAQLIDDAFHFVKENEIYLAVFTDLIQYLSRETDYIAWYPMFKILEYISPFLPFEESTNIKEQIRTILDDLLNEIGYDEDSDKNLMNSLRQEAARWACIFDSSICKNQATKDISRAYQLLKLPMLWKEWYLCKGLMKADHATWDKEFKKYWSGSHPNIGVYLVCTENTTLILSFLELFHEFDRQILDLNGPKEYFYTLQSVIMRHAKTPLVLKYMFENFEKVIHSDYNKKAVLVSIINNVYSDEDLDKIYDYVLNNCINGIQHLIPLIEAKILGRSWEIDGHRQHFRYLI